MPDASQGQTDLGWDLPLEPAMFFPDYREMVRTRRGLAQILIGQEMPPAEWRDLLEQRPAFAPLVASSRSEADAFHVGYTERGGAVWGVGNFRERQLLRVEQACRIVAAANRPLPETTVPSADDLFRRLTEEVAVFEISVPPSMLLQDFYDQFTDTVMDEERIEHLESIRQLHKDWGRVTRAIGNVASAEWHFCMIRAAVTGNTNDSVIEHLNAQAAGGMLEKELTHACTGTKALAGFRSIAPEMRRMAERLSFMRDIHAREVKKQPGDMQFFVGALGASFEDTFNAKAAGGCALHWRLTHAF